jgi:hypothetical protein
MLSQSPKLHFQSDLIHTVKASNFGPHGNFGPFFSEQLATIKTRPMENMNGIIVVDKLLICKVCSVHFWHRIHPTKLWILQEVVQSFHEIQS